MRVLRIANIDGKAAGGMARMMRESSRALEQRGHRIDHWFKDDLGRVGAIAGGRFAGVLLPAFARKFQGYDVVEVHEPISAGLGAWRALSRKGPALVVLSHGLEARHEVEELAYRRKKGLPITLPLRTFRVTVVQSDFGLARADQAICLNLDDCAFLRGGLGLSEKKISLVQNGVSENFFKAARRELPREKSVLFLGSWIVRKGILDFVPAMREVLEKDPAARLTIAGTGPGSEGILREFPSSVSDRIRLIPRIEEEFRLIETYLSHRIFVLPSYFEGQPLVALEAASLGLPVVGTEIGGMKDLFPDRSRSALVRPGEPSELASAIQRALSDDAWAGELAKYSLERAREFTWARTAEQLERAYESAIQNRK